MHPRPPPPPHAADVSGLDTAAEGVVGEEEEEEEEGRGQGSQVIRRARDPDEPPRPLHGAGTWESDGAGASRHAAGRGEEEKEEEAAGTSSGLPPSHRADSRALFERVAVGAAETQVHVFLPSAMMECRGDQFRSLLDSVGRITQWSPPPPLDAPSSAAGASEEVNEEAEATTPSALSLRAGEARLVLHERRPHSLTPGVPPSQWS